jgi:hypothetical protein
MRDPVAPKTDWVLQLVLVTVTSVLVLQNTKHAFLPASQTLELWGAEAVVMACVLVLRSGWARDAAWTDQQGQLGTLANNYYEPRRDALVNGGVVAFGVFGALWWAIATWGVMFYGMRRGVPTRGLIDFIVAALMGALTGGVLGAVLGLATGHFWERRHRRRRREARHA